LVQKLKITNHRKPTSPRTKEFSLGKRIGSCLESYSGISEWNQPAQGILKPNKEVQKGITFLPLGFFGTQNQSKLEVKWERNPITANYWEPLPLVAKNNGKEPWNLPLKN